MVSLDLTFWLKLFLAQSESLQSEFWHIDGVVLVYLTILCIVKMHHFSDKGLQIYKQKMFQDCILAL